MRKKGPLSLAGMLLVMLALPMCSFPADSEGSSDQLLQAARTARLRGNYAQADELYTARIRDLETAGVGDVRLARLLLELGGVRGVQGRCQQAADLFLRGVRILEAGDQPDPFERSAAWEELAKAYSCERQFSKAEPALQHAFDSEQSAPAPRQDRLLEILASQGAVYETERRFAEAEAVFEHARSILDKNPRVDSVQAALLLNNLGMLYRMVGRNPESAAAFRRGLAFAEAAGAARPGMEISLLDNIASLNLAAKQYSEAAAHFERAVRLLDSGTPLPSGAAGRMLRDYATCLRKLGNRSQARALDTRAAALHRSQSDGDSRLVVDATELARAK